MRSGIAFRLSLLLTVFAVLAIGLVGYYAYFSSLERLRIRAEEDMLTATQVLGKNLRITLAQSAQNSSLLAATPLALRILKSDTNASETEKTELAELFSAMLSTYPDYLQIRLISATHHGLEQVRVDRDPGGLVRVTGNDLQEKAHFPYVFETLRRARWGVYMSDIDLNREEGSHAGFERPTLRTATVVQDESGRPQGLIVINLDIAKAFEQLQAGLPSSYRIFLANSWGDFLVHPDPTRTFGFERGQRILMQESYPEISALIKREKSNVIVSPVTGEGAHDDISAFSTLPMGDSADNRFLILGLAQPLDAIEMEASRLRRSIIETAGIFCALAIAVAILLARTVTDPINAMAKAALAFSRGEASPDLPISRRDEIGVLARTFLFMQAQITNQLQALHQHRDELDHLARHDPLTGLPNRRMFMEKLESSIAHAKRSGAPFALLFIDLDRFKHINDSLGHARGDAVLKAVSELLRVSVREVDTVARLGGDEFVVLCENLTCTDDAIHIAQKLHERLQLPMLSEDLVAIGTSASIGISLYPENGTTATELLSSADTAMYQSKGAGRNAFTLYKNDGNSETGAPSIRHTVIAEADTGK